MAEQFLLFVYGLLMRERAGSRSLGLATRVRCLGPERVSGRLYHLGDYPGLVTAQRGLVHGQLVAFRDHSLFEKLDAYELFDPDDTEGSEYRRVEVDLLGSGRRAWAYEYNRPVRNRPIVRSGRWTGR